MKTSTAALVFVAMLAGCGVTYNSPSVQQDANAGAVTVIALSPSVIATANQSPYTPRSLPDAFYNTASGGTLVGAGAIPAAPNIPTARPAKLELRPLPDITPQPYRLGVGDVVLLATKGTASTIEQLSGLLAAQNQRQGYTIRDDGAIAIPEVGPVQLSGMTLPEAEDRLFQVLVEHQIDPSFSLEVAQFNSQSVSVGGAVKQTQSVPITLAALTLNDALTAVGGVTVKDAEFASIRIYRDGNLYQIPLETYRRKPDLQGAILQPSDSIFVDTGYDLDRAMEFYRQKLDVVSLRSSARGNALNALETELSLQRARLQERRANFETRVRLGAEARDYVYLAGEVRNQNRFALPYGTHASLADALYDNGGFATKSGNPAEIYVLRAAPESETVTAYHLDTKNAANIVMATRLQMRPNDVIFIEEQPITKWGRSLQQLLPSVLKSAESSF